MGKLTQSQNEHNSNQSATGDHRAEVFNYQPTTAALQGGLIGQYLSGAGLYPGVPLTPRNQEEKVMYRLGRGKGAPVELPKIQQDETGGGFIAQLTPRVHALKHRHGFRIRNLVDYGSSPVRSWYWLEVNEHGYPLLDTVPMAASKTAKAKNAASKPELPLLSGADAGRQSLLLAPEPMPTRSTTTFIERERGVR
jgi:hypothetical protein